MQKNAEDFNSPHQSYSKVIFKSEKVKLVSERLEQKTMAQPVSFIFSTDLSHNNPCSSVASIFR